MSSIRSTGSVNSKERSFIYKLLGASSARIGHQLEALGVSTPRKGHKLESLGVSSARIGHKLESLPLGVSTARKGQI